MHITELSKAQLDGARGKYTHGALLSGWEMYDDRGYTISTMYHTKKYADGSKGYLAFCGYVHSAPYVVNVENGEDCINAWKRLVRSVMKKDIHKIENIISELTVEISAQQIRADS